MLEGKCCKPTTIETYPRSIRYFIHSNAEYLQHKGTCRDSEMMRCWCSATH